MLHWEINNAPFDGDMADEKIVCQNCHWSWKVKDGGDDLFVCHKCGLDNTRFYLGNEVYSNAVDPNLIVQGVGSLASVGGSIAQSKAQKELGKTDVQREIDTRCGKDKSKSWSKKKRNAYLDCKDKTLSLIDKQRSQVIEKSKQELQFKQKALIESQKNKRNQTYLFVGIVAIVLGIVFYKKVIK